MTGRWTCVLCALIAWVFVLTCGGCTHTAKVTYEPAAVNVAKHTTPITLKLSKEFRELNHVRKRMGDSFEMPFGPALVKYAEFASRSTFADVEVLPAGSEAARSGSVLLVEPRITKIDELMPGLAFQDRSLLMVVEWSFTDAKTGQLRLLLPVEASFTTSNPAGGFTYNTASCRLASGAVAALSDSTIKALSENEDLKRIDRAR